MFGSFQFGESEFGQSAALIVVVPPPPAPRKASGFVALRKGGRAAITHLPRARKETRHFVEFARVSGTCACVAVAGICEGVGRVGPAVNAQGALTARRGSCAGTGLVSNPVTGFLCARSRPGRCDGDGFVDFEPIDERDLLRLVELLDD